MPTEVVNLIGKEGADSMKRSRHVLLGVGRDMARIAVASSMMRERQGKEENSAPVISGLPFAEGSSSSPSPEDALASATLMIDHLLDDGRPSPKGSSSAAVDTLITMSPHRMCRYTDNGSNPSASATEVFGAHTDTSFATVIPVAAVSGLEVYDAAAGTWIRPELMARQHWENEMVEQKKDPSATVGENGKPWHSRYVVCMPGELLQLLTRNSFRAAVHRVVAVTGGQSRLSAPVLLRARPKVVMDVKAFYGSNDVNVVGPLLASCDQMTMEEIHDALQPSGVVD